MKELTKQQKNNYQIEKNKRQLQEIFRSHQKCEALKNKKIQAGWADATEQKNINIRKTHERSGAVFGKGQLQRKDEP